MRLSEATSPVQVRDVTFHVSLSWGELRRLLKRWEQVIAEDETESAAKWLEETFCKVVRSVDGLEDADGKPVERMTREVVAQLPAPMVMQFFTGLASLGAGAPDPTATPTAASDQ